MLPQSVRGKQNKNRYFQTNQCGQKSTKLCVNVDAMNRSLENIVDDEEVKQRKFESYLSLVGLGLGGGLFLIIILTARMNILQSSSRKFKALFFPLFYFSRKILTPAPGCCVLDQPGAEARLRADGGGSEAQWQESGQRHVSHGRVGEAEEGRGKVNVMKRHDEITWKLKINNI